MTETATLKQPGKLLPWVMTLTASLFLCYEFIQSNMFNSISVDLMTSFHIQAKQLGLLSSIYFLANVIFVFPAGMILDRVSNKKIIICTMGLCVLGTALFAGAHSFAFAAFCRFLTGIGSAFCFLSCMRIASRWFSPTRMAFVAGLIVTIAMLGGIIAQTPLTYLLKTTTWRHAVLMDAGLGAIILLLIIIVVKDQPDDYQQTHDEYQETLKRVGFWPSLKLAYARTQNWLCALFTSILNIPVGVFGGFAGSLFLVQADHLSRTTASYIISMIFLGTIVGGPFIGKLSDKLGDRRSLMMSGAALSIVISLLIIYVPSLSTPALLFLFFALGFITSAQVLSYPLIAESNPLWLTATAISICSLLTQGGTMIYQPLFGWLLEMGWQGKMNAAHIPMYSLNDYRHAMLIMPIGFVIAFAAAMLSRTTQQAQLEADAVI